MYNILRNSKKVFEDMSSTPEGQYKRFHTCAYFQECSHMHEKNSSDDFFEFTDQDNSTIFNLDRFEMEDLGNITILED